MVRKRDPARFRFKGSDQAAARDVGPCPTCGKRRYLTRALARRAARLVDGGHRGTYACGEYYHWGHLQERVIRGTSPLRAPGTLGPEQAARLTRRLVKQEEREAQRLARRLEDPPADL